MSRELIRIEPAFEGETIAMLSEAIAVDYVEVLPEDDDPVATPLGEADEEALELGIASVFESLVAGGGEGAQTDATFALLAELNRLWAEPLAA